MTTRIFLFSTTVVMQEVELKDAGYIHRLVIGTIASEWATLPFPAHLTIGGRTFVSFIDGRTIFPTCFEVIAGMEKL